MMYDGQDLQHRDGVPWYDAPLPPRRHECRWQTVRWENYFWPVERCACGARRYDGRGRVGTGVWEGRNSRRGVEPPLSRWRRLTSRFRS